MSAGERLVLYEHHLLPLGKSTPFDGVELSGFVNQGWEVVQLSDGGEYKPFWVLKRPLPHPPPPTDMDGAVQSRGWFVDPVGSELERYFDGEFWTVHLRDEKEWLSQIDTQRQKKLLAEQLLQMGEVGEVFLEERNQDSPPGWYPDWIMPSTNRYRFWDGSSGTAVIELSPD